MRIRELIRTPLGQVVVRCSMNLERRPLYLEEVDSPYYQVLAVRRERCMVLIQRFPRAFEKGRIELLINCCSYN